MVRNQWKIDLNLVAFRRLKFWSKKEVKIRVGEENQELRIGRKSASRRRETSETRKEIRRNSFVPE